jgi:hypothetical protein
MRQFYASEISSVSIVTYLGQALRHRATVEVSLELAHCWQCWFPKLFYPCNSGMHGVIIVPDSTQNKAF